ncbi:hypothetical protein GGS20DRAFT_356597 [Poronia punctata]|nr:hypothetical protein GGS20DRAFT_356597 [Poronia punctata]
MSGSDWKPYTIPYTGAGAFKRDGVWINSSNYGNIVSGSSTVSEPSVATRPPDGASGTIHRAEATFGLVSHPPKHKHIETTGTRSCKGGENLVSRGHNDVPELEITEIAEDGVDAAHTWNLVSTKKGGTGK